MKRQLTFTLLFVTGFLNASTLTQTIRGKVVDQETKAPLYGANVMLAGTSLGSATDENGQFKIEYVTLGRYDVRVTYIGYETLIVPEIAVDSGKEVVLNLKMKESIVYTQAVVVRPSIRKDKPLNTMATTSARSFSVEETRRYAGGLDDPARMASGFSGVTSGQAQDNAIIIRGNAPNSILWRLEGIAIPNPNHFADGNYAGGGLVTIFSSQLLDNSDFMTGAFPGEYGNALSGVFDMNLRNGNNEQREYAFQAGIMGIDFAAEGPFRQGSASSYLFNYRYSTTALLTPILDTEQVPKYQDLSFKLNFPTRQAGIFSLWGIGGADTNLEYAEKDTSKWETAWDRVGYEWEAKVGAIGLTHKYLFGKNTYLQTSLASTLNDAYYFNRKVDRNRVLQDDERIESLTGKHTLSMVMNHKAGARMTLKCGLTGNLLYYNQDFKAAVDDIPPMIPYINESGSTTHAQAFAQTRLDFSENLTLNAGLHSQYFGLNDHRTIEPRIGLQFACSNGHCLSLGYGTHSQLSDLKVYMTRDHEENRGLMNKNLDFSKAHHFVLAYDRSITDNVRLKIEPYYQILFDVPVIADSSYSFSNFKSQWFFDSPLVNNGTGKNLGIEVTLERFLSNDFYYLLTASVFSSKYKGGDGIERHGRYDRNLVINALCGKEIRLGRDNVLGMNLRYTMMGGERLSPVDMTSTLTKAEVVFDESKAFEDQFPSTHTLDVTATYRMNRRGHSHIWALQIKNALGAATYSEPDFNYIKKTVENSKQVIILPSLSYKLEF